jgi:hypothetical protein
MCFSPVIVEPLFNVSHHLPFNFKVLNPPIYGGFDVPAVMHMKSTLMMISRSSLKFQRNILPPSSGLKNMPGEKSARSR